VVVKRFDVYLTTLHLNPELILPVNSATLAQAAARPLKAGLCMERFRRRYPEVPILKVEAALLKVKEDLNHAQGGISLKPSDSMGIAGRV
jgi:hypothetical protein